VLRRLAARLPERYPLLLDSVVAGPLSRASLLLAEPGAALWLDAEGRLEARGLTPSAGGFLAALEDWWLRERSAARPSGGREARADSLPFSGGWALFLGYELAQEIEPHLRLPRSPFPWQAFALRTPCALVHELSRGRVFAVAEPEAEDALGRIAADAREAASASDGADLLRIGRVEEEDASAYLARVRRAKEYVRAGDIYQANLSRPWTVALDDDGAPGAAAALYRRLCAANPAPFAALAQWRGEAILSSSPERLVRVAGRRIETRPIAGTRPRSRQPGGDSREMTVRVDEFMSIESYTHVHHIVSNVSGELDDGVTPIGAVRAVFPGGTITGCPKFRCMQIIAELEAAGRGAYTGSLGYLTRDGRLDLNILIRSMTLSARQLSFRAGAGIVADSDPERELEETRAKARGLLAALGGLP